MRPRSIQERSVSVPVRLMKAAQLATPELFSFLSSSDQGLTQEVAEARPAEHGPNAVAEEEGRGAMRKFFALAAQSARDLAECPGGRTRWGGAGDTTERRGAGRHHLPAGRRHGAGGRAALRGERFVRLAIHAHGRIVAGRETRGGGSTEGRRALGVSWVHAAAGFVLAVPIRGRPRPCPADPGGEELAGAEAVALGLSNSRRRPAVSDFRPNGWLDVRAPRNW